MPLDRPGKVVSVSLSSKHRFSKQVVESIHLLTGLGIEGDAHCGALVRHRYRVKQDPTQPNLCQVHLLQTELFEELAAKGFDLSPGDLGENMTTSGIDLLNLPTGAVLRAGPEAVLEITGIRNPCVQMNKFRKGLMQAVIERNSGKVQMKSGVMSIVLTGGTVRAGDTIQVTLPPPPWRELVCV
jgi:MOSC domain-containing protein YiiM